MFDFFSSSFSTISQANNPPHTFLLQATSDATWIRNRQLVLRWGSLPRIIRGIAFRPGSSFFGCPLFNNPLRYIKSTTQKKQTCILPRLYFNRDHYQVYKPVSDLSPNLERQLQSVRVQTWNEETEGKVKGYWREVSIELSITVGCVDTWYLP